jgi:hypothetical protein
MDVKQCMQSSPLQHKESCVKGQVRSVPVGGEDRAVNLPENYPKVVTFITGFVPETDPRLFNEVALTAQTTLR